MKNGINKVTLMGNVGDQPKVSEKNGEPFVASFPLATNETYKDKDGEEQTKTEWHRVKVWNKRAFAVRDYVHKGDLLYVEGKIVGNSWDDKDGNKCYSTEIECDNFVFLTPRKTESK